jgi:hypothetical protein
MKHGTRKGQDVDTCGASAQQNTTAFIDRCACGVNVIDQQDAVAIDAIWAHDAKRARDVVAPFLLPEFHLWTRGAHALQREGIESDTRCVSQRPRQQLCLVEPAPPQPLHVQGDRHQDVIVADCKWSPLDQQCAERAG